MYIGKDSLKKRYFYKLSNNTISLPISFITQAIVPRLLGPNAYGSYNYLTNFFNIIFSFFDFGTSTALYVILSQRPEDYNIIKFYYRIMAITILTVFLLVLLAYVFNLKEMIWPDQIYYFIILALIWGVLNWILQIFQKIIDAYGYTITGEKFKILSKLLGVVLIIVYYIIGIKELHYYFIYQYLTMLFVIIFFIRILKNSNIFIFSVEKLNNQDYKRYKTEFVNYSYPLFISSLFVLLGGLIDRWMLQRFAGTVQQGYFGLSFQISTLCFIFTSAMTPLFQREFSIAHFEKDIYKMKELYIKYVPLLFTISAYISIFLAVRGDIISDIMGGKEFSQAKTAVSIMALYPIHQTYGQLNESVLLATKKTKLYRNLSIISSLIGIVFTIIFVGPSQNGFLSLGATGLALKMVIVQIVVVNLTIWFNCRILELSFLRLILQETVLLLILLINSYAIKIIFFNSDLPSLVLIIIEGILYTIFSFNMILIFPRKLVLINLRIIIDIIKQRILS